MSLGPGKVDFGGTRSVMDIGDAVLCRVQEVEETHSSVVTMKGMGLRKIRSGVVEEIDPHLWKDNWKGGETLRRMKADGVPYRCGRQRKDVDRRRTRWNMDVRNRLSEISRDNRGGRN